MAVFVFQAGATKAGRVSLGFDGATDIGAGADLAGFVRTVMAGYKVEVEKLGFGETAF